MFKTKIIKFFQLSYNDKSIIFSSIYNIIYSIFILKFYKFKKSYTYFSKKYDTDKKVSVDDLENIKNLSELNTSTANALPFKITCLQKSFSLWLMLRKNGFDVDLILGVNNLKQDFAAHAWVEYDGIVLNDKPDVSTDFSTINLSD